MSRWFDITIPVSFSIQLGRNMSQEEAESKAREVLLNSIEEGLLNDIAYTDENGAEWEFDIMAPSELEIDTEETGDEAIISSANKGEISSEDV